MLTHRIWYASVLVGLASANSTLALHKLFTSHMVLQADGPAQVFGWAAPGAVVAVALSDGTAARAIAAADDGRWLAALAAHPASTAPLTLTVSAGGASIELSDVLFGDVWLCSGEPRCLPASPHTAAAARRLG